MSKGTFQQVIIIGNIGNDPEIRFMPNGNAVANFSLATTESWKDQQGQQQERVEWHRCVAYRKVADIISKYVKKGSKIQIIGKLQTREWTDQQQVKRYTTEIIVNEMQMLDGAQQQQGQQQSQPVQQQRQQPTQQQPQQGYQYNHQQAQQPQNSGGFNEPPMDWDDQIPF